MKKIIPFFMTTFVFVGTGGADQGVKGGFVGPNMLEQKITTVQDVSKLRDDTTVFMQGKIVNSLGHERYTFMDETGKITVEIDDEDWNGVTVTPETLVQIYGEVDKGVFKKTKIDVDLINLM
ncbi:MAG: YgiW/YdeI family stress tolerance OB fold protein [Alphaproteobacteria bacterium]